MSANFYETELRKALEPDIQSGHLRELGESSLIFEQLARAFPANGSKIDWARVPGSIERVEEQDALQAEQFVEFFDEMLAKSDLSGDVVYVGDSATDFALEGSVGSMRKVLPELLSVPQHHYFIGSQCSWCISLTMEGDMGFGFSCRVRQV